ncbi:MAG: FAD-dependent oxidoreductase [Hyphomicrobium sp.]|nr:FAD-dependent oxidoreductase [Hyphomicrobium sp.]
MTKVIECGCVIAGGGPAGLMLGYLLARAGIDVTVLEKHADFLRDFRGDTIHPSTLEVMYELGLLEELLTFPHNKVRRLTLQFGRERLGLVDFSGLGLRSPFIAMMPQWDFLNLIARAGAALPNFRLAMRSEAKALVFDGDRVIGVDSATPEGLVRDVAPLVVGCDGRGSLLREQSGLPIEILGAPMDVLWFRLPRKATDTEETMGNIAPGRMLVMLNRGDYWQCAYVITKGSHEDVTSAGLAAFQSTVGDLLPIAPQRAQDIRSFDDVKPLTVRVDRLAKWWRPGLLFIGDAAHAMSPIGGVGVNLAIQDAVAAANVLALPLREGRLEESHLAAVEARRRFPTRLTQSMQVGVQNQIIARALSAKPDGGDFRPPLAMRMMASMPFLNRLPAYLIGVGVRPEHVAPFIRSQPIPTP